MIDPTSELSQVLLMHDDQDGAATYFVYGNGLISQETFGGNNSSYRVFHYDYRGSTTAMTDAEGNVTDRFLYDPYGKITRREGETDTISQYVGKWGVQTDENRLIHMRARFYSPELKRFLNEDPIRDGLNWYVYAGNNSLRAVGPMGKAPTGPDVLDLGGAYFGDFKVLEREEAKAAAERLKVFKIMADSFTPIQNLAYIKTMSTFNPDGDVTIKSGSLQITPFITNSEGNRSATAYNMIIDQFSVEDNPRYTPKNGDTYCNIFMWDVTLAMGAEIPHYVDGLEINANRTATLLAEGNWGWVEVSQKKLRREQMQAIRP